MSNPENGQGEQPYDNTLMHVLNGEPRQTWSAMLDSVREMVGDAVKDIPGDW